MPPEIVAGDLLDQPTEAIVNAWNRHLIPWWLLVPHGVSGAIRQRAGTAPFRELAKHGLLPLGGAVVTGAGRLPHRAIVHVAGLGLLWTTSETAVRQGVRNALRLATERRFASIAFPRLGAGVGGANADRVERWMTEEFAAADYPGRVVLVRYAPPARPAVAPAAAPAARCRLGRF
ncbi:macro domain-containing protein [Alienimonas californiensis]|uniref:O-acetyl-ADP-ribose deacetylase n=1 Tax=Alienimonas californiensis TaxID=2527989 RepID=A0A517P539_9PLAN|nr:macro domain-containing protein [Alienimonas californiensis]QDT14497.1 O-acetyl-ADP-ribose deacetylase [Alienimonas californiensis]